MAWHGMATKVYNSMTWERGRYTRSREESHINVQRSGSFYLIIMYSHGKKTAGRWETTDIIGLDDQPPFWNDNYQALLSLLWLET